MTTSPRTRLAALGTLSDLHRQPIAFDLACLRSLVARLAPDLLCAEVTTAAWEGRDLTTAALVVREGLVPVVRATNVVLIPVVSDPREFDDFGVAGGWRKRGVRTLRRLLQWGGRRASRVEAINGAWFGQFCHALCWVTEQLWSPAERVRWEAQTQSLADNVLRAVRRDPGRRVLVVVQCQRLHRLVPLLKAHRREFDLVSYEAL